MDPDPGAGTVAILMRGLRAGNHAAAEKLIELFYPELRRMAGAQMQAERSPHTWQPTALVHELYLQLIKIKPMAPGAAGLEGSAEHAAFLALAARIMRNLLLMHARPMARRAKRVDPDSADVSDTQYSALEDLQAVHAILNRLEAIDPNLRAVVEMKVFEGLNMDEIAARLKCSPRTAARHWEFARHWLERHLSPEKSIKA